MTRSADNNAMCISMSGDDRKIESSIQKLASVRVLHLFIYVLKQLGSHWLAEGINEKKRVFEKAGWDVGV